jgi:hypothetical protein
MQRHGFDVHDVFCSTPGNLEAELDAFHRVLGEINEKSGMPRKTLFAGLCLKSDNLIFVAGEAAKVNIRYCTYFVQVLDKSWGPVGLFRELYDVAIACVLDDQSPMRGAAIFAKAAALIEIPEGAPIYRYDDIASFEAQLRTLLKDWLDGLHSI